MVKQQIKKIYFFKLYIYKVCACVRARARVCVCVCVSFGFATLMISWLLLINAIIVYICRRNYYKYSSINKQMTTLFQNENNLRTRKKEAFAHTYIFFYFQIAKR